MGVPSAEGEGVEWGWGEKGREEGREDGDNWIVNWGDE